MKGFGEWNWGEKLWETRRRRRRSERGGVRTREEGGRGQY
jgi:hypothetical protein